MDNIIRDTRSLCTPSKLPASDYVINPYLGCTHRCQYCYASFMGRFTGHREPWGTYLEARRYQSYRLPANLEGKTILIGSVTDVYQPAEARCCLMPPILDVLKSCRAHTEILTKSALVLRDIELLQAIPDVAVGLSLSNLCQADNDRIEPGASSVSERLAALRELHEAGIRTFLFAAPYLPGLTDLDSLAQAVSGSVDYICVENLNLRGTYKRDMLNLMEQLHPDLTALYQYVFLSPEGGEYWKRTEDELTRLRERVRVPVISYLYHDKIKKRGVKA